MGTQNEPVFRQQWAKGTYPWAPGQCMRALVLVRPSGPILGFQVACSGASSGRGGPNRVLGPLGSMCGMGNGSTSGGTILKFPGSMHRHYHCLQQAELTSLQNPRWQVWEGAGCGNRLGGQILRPPGGVHRCQQWRTGKGDLQGPRQCGYHSSTLLES